MTRSRIFVRVISKVFWVQPGQSFLSLAALTVGATLASAFLSLYFELPRKMSAEFRSLGPNLVLAPRGNAETLPESAYAQLAADYSPIPSLAWLYAVGKVNQEDVILGGTELDQLGLLNPGWKIPAGVERKGSQDFPTSLASVPASEREQRTGWLLAGQKAAAHFGWQVGERVRLEYGSGALELPLTGIVSTGGSEDSQLLLSIADLQNLAGRQGELSFIQLAVPGSAPEIEAVRQTLDSRFPQLEVRPLRQVVESEARVVLKVRGLMFGLTAIVLAIVILTVMTRVSGLVLARQREIGVMKALGGSDGGVAALLLAETASLALVAGAAGYVLGFGLAQWAVYRIFHAALAWRWDVLPAVIGVTVAVALLASALPIQRVRRLEPAAILKGD